MADPPPPDILHMLVGFRFHPTDQEIIGHYLHHKLLADDPSIDDTIPEIGTCKYEPWDLLGTTCISTTLHSASIAIPLGSICSRISTYSLTGY